MGTPLILLGLLLVLAGLFANMAPQLKIPLLPGDIFVQKEGFTLYIPVTSSILLSILLAVVMRFIR